MTGRNGNGNPDGSSTTNPLSVFSSVLFTLIIALLHFALSRVANDFKDVYEEFGTDLPWLTELILPGSPYYWGVPVLLSLCYLTHQLGFISRGMTMFITSIGTIGSLLIWVVGLYLPVFELGAVISS